MRCASVFIIAAFCVGASWQFCERQSYKPGTSECTLEDGTTIGIGENYKQTSRCVDCSCSGSIAGGLYLSCCGYGIHAGVFAAPPGCKVIAGDDGCAVLFVNSEDESQPCE